MNRKKIKWKNIFLTLFIFILIVILIISSINIVKWYKDSKKNDKQITKIYDKVKVEEKTDNDNTVIIESQEDLKNPYWDYIKMNLIDVDFSKLKSENDEVAGWIQVNGTNINYPFVKTSDNDFYLHHTFDKSYNNAGWVFMDYRNNKDEFDKNTILYAHGRLDNTMFGSLRKILKSGWLNDVNNHVIKLSTEKENTLWQVFSVYRIPTTNDYIQTTFSNDAEFKKFLDLLINRSSYKFNVSVNEFDKILTLSTCYDDNDKVVLHAKLIKKEAK